MFVPSPAVATVSLRRGRADGFAMEALLQLRTVKATQALESIRSHVERLMSLEARYELCFPELRQAADQTLLHFITLQMEKQCPTSST